jgi:putative FmdB family regulatory protein
MPLYEYECDACAHRFEVIQKFSDPPITTCPACAGTVHKLLSSPAIQFKGSGFYLTDYGRGTGKKEPAKDDTGEVKGAKKDGASASDAGSGAASKGDSKTSGESKPASSDSKSGSSESKAAAAKAD